MVALPPPPRGFEVRSGGTLGILQIGLTTIGRRTGMPRDVPLYAFEDADDRLVIVGSLAGAPEDPNWVRNLRANPRATVRRGRKPQAVHATEVAEPSERGRLWRLVCGEFPLYATYQRRTTRRFPLFVLESAGES
jgi:deazaflavin-dependent oxidoreductase (nitroreductase family)